MFVSMQKKRLACCKPFHQKVLHFQYEIPLSGLKSAFELSTQLLTSKQLLMAEERDDLPFFKTEAKVDFNFDALLPKAETAMFGVFDEDESFYIKVQIDSVWHAKVETECCGNLFIFGAEEQIKHLGNELNQKGLGQLMIESTADYFSLLED